MTVIAAMNFAKPQQPAATLWKKKKNLHHEKYFGLVLRKSLQPPQQFQQPTFPSAIGRKQASFGRRADENVMLGNRKREKVMEIKSFHRLELELMFLIRFLFLVITAAHSIPPHRIA